MKAWRLLRGTAVSLACLGFLMPPSVFGAEPGSIGRRSAVVDVALVEGGTLVGQVTDQSGAALSDIKVSIKQDSREVATAQTDAGGRFAVRGLRGGVYRVDAAGGSNLFRLWAPQTAPPSAQQAALVVSSGDAVRGQFGGGVLGFLANPWVIAGVVATAIAVPLAVNRSSGS